MNRSTFDLIAVTLPTNLPYIPNAPTTVDVNVLPSWNGSCLDRWNMPNGTVRVYAGTYDSQAYRKEFMIGCGLTPEAADALIDAASEVIDAAFDSYSKG